MGMNHLRDRLIAFDEALSAFQEVLRGALMDQEQAKSRIANQWDDDFGREFEVRYSALNDPLLAAHREIDARLKPDVEGRIHSVMRYLG